MTSIWMHRKLRFHNRHFYVTVLSYPSRPIRVYLFLTQPHPHSSWMTLFLFCFFMSVAVQNTTQSGQSSPWGSKISPKDIRDPNFWTVTLLYPCIYGILVDVAVKMFALLALQLTKFENHRTQSTFINRLVLKVISHF